MNHSPLFSPSKVFKTVFQAVVTHLKTLYLVLDTVKDGPPLKENQEIKAKSSFKKQNFCLKKFISSPVLDYLFPLLLWLYISAESYYLYWWNDFQLYDGSPVMDRLFSHRLFPKDSWQQGDVITTISLAMAIAIYLCLITRPPLEEKLTMYAVVDFNVNNNSNLIAQVAEKHHQLVIITQNGQGKTFSLQFYAILKIFNFC